MVGCKQSPEQIGKTVQGSMQQTFDKDPNFSPAHFKVDKVVAVKKTDTDYDGTASINYQGKEHDVPVHIILDQDKINWKTDPAPSVLPNSIPRKTQQTPVGKPSLTHWGSCVLASCGSYSMSA